MGSVHLIRHGQASFGSDDYDQLSPVGMQQSTALGMSWEASGWAPTAAVAGSMTRHAQTAIAAIDACGQGDGYDIDDGWNEYDHLAIANAHDPAARPRTPRSSSGTSMPPSTRGSPARASTPRRTGTSWTGS